MSLHRSSLLNKSAALATHQNFYPLTPPETDSGSLFAGHVQWDSSTTLDPEQGQAQSSRPYMPRKTSTLSYQSPSLKDPRDRLTQRTTKNLIVVLPPSDFPDHGQLGSVLSTGPRRKLGHGILMPLFPTVYGQLTAIAREFNFPSTVGLCLYLHIAENGVTMTPRISDDTWQALWGHLFEACSPTLNQHLPICGRVEFDIDVSKARWFHSWITRDSVEAMFPSSGSIYHGRGESRTTFDELNDDRAESRMSNNGGSRPSRHVPRKLSLVDKMDVCSVTSGGGPRKNSVSPQETKPPHTLSPIPQSALPIHAELEQKVNSWRVVASQAPDALFEAYLPGSISRPTDSMNLSQYPLAPEEATLDEPAQDEETHSILEINLEDFAWSVTSAGPLSSLEYYPESPCRLPSVHMDRRAQGSVLLTPTTATSWGPPDDDDISLISYASRYPSPDLGARMFEDCPPTPSTATSWGAPDDDGLSFISYASRFPSPDIGARMIESCPPTPSTATSWGAPDDDGVSYISNASRYPSPDIAFRVLEDVDELPFHHGSTISPPYASSLPWHHVWPYNGNASSLPWHQVWPYLQGEGYSPLEMEGSHFQSHESSVKDLFRLQANSALSPQYPQLEIYPPVYPYLCIYPESKVNDSISEMSCGFDHDVIYQAVYPHFNIYPAVHERNQPIGASQSRDSEYMVHPTVSLFQQYPYLSIYPAQYPYNLDVIYPAFDTRGPSILTPGRRLESASQTSCSLPIVASLPMAYPSFNLYPPVYPYIEPYPSVQCRSMLDCDSGVTKSNTTSQFGAVYPFFNIYPAAYPNFDIYPSISAPSLVSVSRTKSVEESPQISHIVYPSLVIYLPVYPHFDLYPARSVQVAEAGTTDTSSVPYKYPFFTIYPAVYPYFDLYPAPSAQLAEAKAVAETSLASFNYPFIVIYPAAYPYFDLYPAPSVQLAETKAVAETSLASYNYPFIVIYPAAYPYFDLYPARSAQLAETKAVAEISLASYNYPFLVIYPAIYPHFDLYPTPWVELAETKAVAETSMTSFNYPFLVIYPAVYPHFDLYPSSVAGLTQSITWDIREKYLVINIYPDVYPFFDLYPALLEVTTLKRAKKSHAELHGDVFRDGAVRTPIGTVVASPRHRKTHAALHDEVFRNNVVWTPSGYTQDITAICDLVTQPKPIAIEAPVISPRPSRARSETLTRERMVPALPSLPLKSPGIPLPPNPHSPPPRSPPPRSTTGVKFPHTVKSLGSTIMQTRGPTSPSLQAGDQVREMVAPVRTIHKIPSQLEKHSSLMIPPKSPTLPGHPASDLLGRTQSMGHRPRESLVLQRARAYDKTTASTSTHEPMKRNASQTSTPSQPRTPSLSQRPRDSSMPH